MIEDPIAKALDALGDPTRRRVYEAVLLRPRRIGQLARELPTSRPSISRHVAILKAAGLVCEVDGVFSASIEPLPALRTYFDRLWFEASVGEAWLWSRFQVSQRLLDTEAPGEPAEPADAAA